MFIHFTWPVPFFWLHFLFQWFWFLSITERPEFVLWKASVKKIWLQQNQKSLKKLAKIKQVLGKPQLRGIKIATSYVELTLTLMKHTDFKVLNVWMYTTVLHVWGPHSWRLTRLLKHEVRDPRVLCSYCGIPPSPKQNVTDTPLYIWVKTNKARRKSFLRPGFKPGPTDLRSELLNRLATTPTLENKILFPKSKGILPLKWTSVVVNN